MDNLQHLHTWGKVGEMSTLSPTYTLASELGVHEKQEQFMLL